MILHSGRRYHLGIDWGTSTTKLVLRDYEQGKAFVLYPPGNKESYRYPSTITLVENHLYFGSKAEMERVRAQHTYDALKADLYRFVHEDNRNDEATDQENLATLYLAHSMSIGMNFAEIHAGRTNAQAFMGITLGIPAEELEQSKLRQVYTRVARVAYELAVRQEYDPQEKNYDEALERLWEAKEKDGKRPIDQLTYAQWLRPELAAAMYWGTQSPAIQCDLYSCVDIGAWTVNASYFRIHPTLTGEKGGISFLGGVCQPPGVIDLLKAVARDSRCDFISLIGEEERYLSQHDFEPHIDTFRDKYFGAWQKGFNRAYQKEARQGAWDGKLNVMVIGGGSRIERVRRMFQSKFPLEGWDPPKPIPDLGIPKDLYEFPASGIIPQKPFLGDHTFLLVAYGLSVHSGDFPKTTLAPWVKPLPTRRRGKELPTPEELGYDDK